MLRLFAILFFALACTSSKTKQNSYKSDLVSVDSAIELAYSAYLKACVDFHPSHSFNKCQKLARNHVKTNIEEILEQ